MKKIISTFILLLFVTSAFSQIDSIKRAKLKEMWLFPYPSLMELNDLVYNDSLLKFKPIRIEDTNESFNNNEDLEFLKSIKRTNKIVFIGENHYSRNTDFLRNRIFFGLNTFDYYPLLVLENQYSITGYVNYYLQISDELKAEAFFKNELNTLINTEEDLQLLLYIRKWNKQNPDKILTVGFSDIEHDYKTTFKKILLPYFEKNNQKIDIDIENIMVFELPAIIQKMREILTIAEKSKFVGEYDFLTPAYISTVVDNLESLFKSYYFDFTLNRQNAIIRNLTDSRFLGKYLKANKICIHGGNYHSATKFSYPKGENLYREGSYFNNEYDLTKGKTFSINITTLGFSLDKMAELSIDSCLQQGNQYNWMVQNFQNAYKNKLITADDFLFTWEISNFQKLIIKNSIKNSDCAILLESFNWPVALKLEKFDFQNLKQTQHEMSFHNIDIFIPFSPIKTARKNN